MALMTQDVLPELQTIGSSFLFDGRSACPFTSPRGAATRARRINGIDVAFELTSSASKQLVATADPEDAAEETTSGP